MINARIQGIPCLIDVINYECAPALGPWADNDMDCYGYAEIDFEVCDRRGRPAPWLERKMTDSDVTEIEALITADMGGDDDCDY